MNRRRPAPPGERAADGEMRRETELAVALSVCLSLLVPACAAGYWQSTDAGGTGVADGGVLDPKIGEVGPSTGDGTTDERRRDSVSATWRDLHHSTVLSTPVENTLRVENGRSSLAADRVGVAVDYAESDGVLGASGNAEATARSLRVSALSYGGRDLLGPTVRDENGNGRYDLDDLTRGRTAQNLTSLPGLEAGERADLRMVLTGQLLGVLRAGDGIEFEVVIRPSASGFRDADASSGNVIRYS